MLLETLLYGFTVTGQTGPHRHCIDQHCLLKGSKRACVTETLAKYMATQNTSQLNQNSDWALLDKALKNPEEAENRNILAEFAKRSNSYGLRYSSHLNLGKSFVLRLLRSCWLFLQWDEPLWGKGISQELIHHYEREFLTLCAKSEAASSGEIYRLYDLLEGKTAIPDKFKLEEFLSLFFAFGYSQPDYLKAFPKSIGELLAKYQFFYQFSKDAKEYAKKHLGPSPAVHTKYLTSTASYVNRLWAYYSIVSSRAFSVDSNLFNNQHVQNVQKQLTSTPKSILSKDDQKIFQLKTAFSGAIQQKSCLSLQQIQTLALPFKSNFEATYHPFKHGDASDHFFRRGRKTVFDDTSISDRDVFQYVQNAVVSYITMIKEIVLEGEIVKIQPHQFNSGLVFKFHKKQFYKNKERSYGVLVQCHPEGSSYILTCF